MTERATATNKPHHDARFAPKAHQPVAELHIMVRTPCRLISFSPTQLLEKAALGAMLYGLIDMKVDWCDA